MKRPRRISSWLAPPALAALALAPFAEIEAVRAAGPNPALYEHTVSEAIEYLRAQGRAPNGSYSSQTSPAITALVTTALMRHGRTPDDPLVAESLKYLEQFVQENGGIYQPGTLYRNYETSVAMVCLAEANRDGRYRDVLTRADRFVKGIQWDAGEGHDESSNSFGGAGYGRHKRPDLSNTSFLIDALVAFGNGPDDPAIQNALTFVSRCQNLETEFNTTPFASKVDDGGFYYTAAAGGSSQAGETPNGGLRSYGSMTYAGLKSMIHAGLDADDPRVKAATTWLAKFYDVSSNPGMGSAGLYYYYHTMAKALATAKIDTLESEDGVAHDWRRELVEELARRQQDDGSWINENERWLEGDPNLVTAYALLALSYCRPEETP